MDNLEFIDAYFQNSLNEDERRAFEKKCVDEKAFAEDVAFYISARQVLKEELIKTKQQSWNQEETVVEDREPISIERGKPRYGWLKYAVAACLMLGVATFIFEGQESPRQMADKYIVEKYATLSNKMGVEEKFSAANEAYYSKDYTTSLALFQAILSEQPNNNEALKYVGIVSYRMENYDKAIEAFDQLSKMDLQVNPGLFLKALTLLKRDGPGDKEQARQLLQTVVDQQLGDSKEAKKLLEKF